MEFQKEIDTMVAMEEDLFEESAFAEYAENSSYEIFRFHLNRSQQERLIERCQTIHNFMKKEFGDINNFFDWEYQLKIVGEQLEDEGLEFCAFADDGLGMGFLVTDEKFLSKTEYEKLLYLCYKIKENYENNIA